MTSQESHYTEIGSRLSASSGIVELMEDLGRAMSGADQGTMRMLGGGNPAAIPGVQEVFRRRMAEIVANADECDRMLVNYDGPAGSPRFRAIVAEMFASRFGWNITAENVAITAGGQAAFFQLFALFGGHGPRGLQRILLPIVPEYIGYADQGLASNMFAAHCPRIELRGDHEFKYHVDFDHLESSANEPLGAIAASRPTNPSGNVLSDIELTRLREFAAKHRLPLILDNAYGQPFPAAMFTDAHLPHWGDDLVMVFSLSKVGLPGARTAIVVAHPEIIQRVSSMTAVVGLANNNLGQAIVGPMLASGELLQLSREVIHPFYAERSQFAKNTVHREFGNRFPYLIHANEGAFFLWLWLPELPISTRELYQRLKKKNVLVVPGEYFFYGLPPELDWPHRRQCIRITFSQSPQVVSEGLRIMAEELAEINANR
ncbi:MAG: valine--pyruvate transaminase [Pirellulales bacterium]|nr:valine--pyruvate transaminase [Pirellulales bacterium]